MLKGKEEDCNTTGWIFRLRVTVDVLSSTTNDGESWEVLVCSKGREAQQVQGPLLTQE